MGSHVPTTEHSVVALFIFVPSQCYATVIKKEELTQLIVVDHMHIILALKQTEKVLLVTATRGSNMPSNNDLYTSTVALSQNMERLSTVAFWRRSILAQYLYLLFQITNLDLLILNMGTPEGYLEK